MDRHLGYVAMSRHRARVELHWGADSITDTTGWPR
jgi:ATP-dependent exoDNAse (exonuclease V) alpha subunit